MTVLKRRAVALENEFAHKHDMAFMAEARRNALVGLWAASILGHADAQGYAEHLARSGVEGDEAVISQLRRDFSKAGIFMTDSEFTDKMVSLLRKATEALKVA